MSTRRSSQRKPKNVETQQTLQDVDMESPVDPIETAGEYLIADSELVTTYSC
jgi:hypothetical protein